MKKLNLLTAVASLVLANAAHAQSFQLSFSNTDFTGTGTVTATSNSDGTFTATGGTFTFSLGTSKGQTYYLDPLALGASSVTLAGIQDSGGLNLTGNDVLGPSYISDDPNDGALIFSTQAPTTGSDPSLGDVIALYQNTDDSYGFLASGVDFSGPGTQYIEEDGTGAVLETPEPSSWSLLLSVFPLLYLCRRVTRSQAAFADISDLV